MKNGNLGQQKIFNVNWIIQLVIKSSKLPGTIVSYICTFIQHIIIKLRSHKGQITIKWINNDKEFKDYRSFDDHLKKNWMKSFAKYL
jgi:hypothetical protein